jgi:hypothetical protein
MLQNYHSEPKIRPDFFYLFGTNQANAQKVFGFGIGRVLISVANNQPGQVSADIGVKAEFLLSC